jgi:hypothetical protein
LNEELNAKPGIQRKGAKNAKGRMEIYLASLEI